MAHFTEFFTRLREDLDQGHRDRQQFCRETRAHVRELANRVRHELAEFAEDMRGAHHAFRGGR